jgi:hypothetical protein
MKTRTFFIICLLFLATDCKKDEPATIPVLSTCSLTDKSATAATFEINIASDGGAKITSCGICWSTTAKPTIADSTTVCGTGTGQFVSSLSGLTPGTTYYVRAYASNSAGTAYGDYISFSTFLGPVPLVTTGKAEMILRLGLILKGTVNANGLSTTVTFEYGTTTSYGRSVTAIQSPVEGDSIIHVSALVGYDRPWPILFRVKAKNSNGVVYGTGKSFKP